MGIRYFFLWLWGRLINTCQLNHFSRNFFVRNTRQSLRTSASEATSNVTNWLANVINVHQLNHFNRPFLAGTCDKAVRMYSWEARSSVPRIKGTCKVKWLATWTGKMKLSKLHTTASKWKGKGQNRPYAFSKDSFPLVLWSTFHGSLEITQLPVCKENFLWIQVQNSIHPYTWLIPRCLILLFFF